MIKKPAIWAGIIGCTVNFILFLTKLYIGIASNSLAIYCDSINNLGDTFACIIAALGISLSLKLGGHSSERAQSLSDFVISLFIAACGLYFIYNGADRIFYPLPISYSVRYAIIIVATIFVKILLGVFFYFVNKKTPSPIFKALLLDSFLDCFITLFAIMGLFLVNRINLAVDGIFAVICGLAITVSAIKNIISESKFLITDTR
ncbi:MAG: cation transporter [Eubacterium sp.]|nr:cation transporter [Eubacterium sp.]